MEALSTIFLRRVVEGPSSRMWWLMPTSQPILSGGMGVITQIETISSRISRLRHLRTSTQISLVTTSMAMVLSIGFCYYTAWNLRNLAVVQTLFGHISLNWKMRSNQVGIRFNIIQFHQ